ncbi:S41 family peptidase [bacterium]|nr:S41 family peptidase [bacterium]
MNQRLWILWSFLAIALAAAPTLGGTSTNVPVTPPPAVNAAEVIKILQTDYVDRTRLDKPALERATVDGVLQLLGPGATILTADALASNETASATAGAVTQALARAEVIEPDIGYIRLADVTGATVAALDAELEMFREAQVTGFILDLRFADGTNYAAAAAVAGRFHANGQELFVLRTAGGPDQKFAAPKPSELPTVAGGALGESPLILLVNGETRGSAEALAGALRAQDRGILIGSSTAGAPAAWKDTPLTNGQVLRVATAKIALSAADGSGPFARDLFPAGLAPDIAVPLDLAVERDTLLNAATNVTLTASLQPRTEKKRISEADLVKAFRGEALEDQPAADDEDDSEIQEVKDVVLQRAVDILKGIRMLLSWR